MIGLLHTRSIGADVERVDGRAKVTGAAAYAFDQPVENPAYLHPVRSAVARGRVTGLDTAAAEAADGVLAVLTHRNAPRLASTDDTELAVLQDDAVAFHGQFVAAVVAETPEAARRAAALVAVEYAGEPHDVVLSADRDDLYAAQEPEEHGDVDAAIAAAAVVHDATYTTPPEFNNPMEPHTSVAVWDDGGLTVYESTQGVHTVRPVLAEVFGLDPERVRVIARYVGGGFGSKGTVHANVVLAGLAARALPGRPVKFALTRQDMFRVAGYRTPTVQRVRLAADADGRLTAVEHDVVEQSARIKEFVEGCTKPTRGMYAAPNRRYRQRMATLDVPVTSWMRAPGECPGMFALESAMDEAAIACGLDPVEFRVRNDTRTDPDSGKPFSTRNLVACLREGARRFGWEGRDPAPGVRRDGDWLVGTGVAGSCYPVISDPGSAAVVRYGADGRYQVSIGAADIGTGAWTALTQIAADALRVPMDRIDLRIGDSALPRATVAGGSSGTTNWGTAVVEAARAFRDQHGVHPREGDEARGEMRENTAKEHYAMSAYGAQFAEVRVHAGTGEVRVQRMVGVFAVGRIVNARTARSQLLGGMVMGVSMALHEHGVRDPRFGHVVNHDLAEYHVAANADIGDMEAVWIEEEDPHVNPMGTKGIGEIGIVGAAAAIANAAHHATGVRVRDLPLTTDAFVR
ncbi:xanthine dehydrogenase family protein molybdopterin-binding subunit [Nocardiopsis trehalosi]|uniref:xanthine dehydrogenase family protein molybdopterin-binding subunit n=1 Tax=Nocardiopsis trehalosi TaxID=109329 RepID=UPI00082DC9C5|nr:xanthine dehydrogenase family protein molybdopterin-binding subunit [Nocardiopsis trehalosi]